MALTPYQALKAIGYTPLQAKAIVRGAAGGNEKDKEAIRKALEEAEK